MTTQKELVNCSCYYKNPFPWSRNASRPCNGRWELRPGGPIAASQKNSDPSNDKRRGARYTLISGDIRDGTFQLESDHRSSSAHRPPADGPLGQSRHQYAGQQDESLQRNLPERTHQQRPATGAYRLCRKVALDLALIATEVAQHQEQPTQKS